MGGEGRGGETGTETQERPRENPREDEGTVKLCYHKPRNSKNHQSLEKAKKDPPLECLGGV